MWPGALGAVARGCGTGAPVLVRKRVCGLSLVLVLLSVAVLPSGWAATSEPLLVAPIRAPILSPRAPLDFAAASPEPAHLNRLTQGHERCRSPEDSGR